MEVMLEVKSFHEHITLNNFFNLKIHYSFEVEYEFRVDSTPKKDAFNRIFKTLVYTPWQWESARKRNKGFLPLNFEEKGL